MNSRSEPSGTGSPSTPSRGGTSGRRVVIAILLFGIAFGVALSLSVQAVLRNMKASAEVESPAGEAPTPSAGSPEASESESAAGSGARSPSP